ncbi:hypothetical protein [Litchfieldella xinjiangensis]|uniref:hypothetical protein n=1 Tax=Litchfieldella xinjiangensis TaxID=1166948 RepID=UPI0005BA4BE7|nr:hypothetical protein [Halomonas xinjiangensis]
MQTKFLSDGRKVAVVGQLNNQESIVQEVFVTEAGDEIPAGERFTTKSLHDSPVKSYKAKEEERIEKRIQEQKAEIERLEKQKRSAHIEAKAHADIGKFVRKVAAGMEPEDFSILVAFLAGDIKWLVCDGYGFEEPVRFEDKLTDTDGWHGRVEYDGLKLLSLYGKTDGSLSYRLNRYGDGSGSNCQVYGFATFEEAARKSIDLTLQRLDKSMNSHGMAADVLCSSVAEYLTSDERTVLRGKIEVAIERAHESYEKQAADLAERSNKSISDLQKLLEPAA